MSSLFACTALPACLHVSVTGSKDETDSKANATKSEAPVLSSHTPPSLIPSVSACTALPACLPACTSPLTGGKDDETDSKANATKSEANATKSEAPVLPKMIKKTIQVTRKKTYNVSTGRSGCRVPSIALNRRPLDPLKPSKVQS